MIDAPNSGKLVEFLDTLDVEVELEPPTITLSMTKNTKHAVYMIKLLQQDIIEGIGNDIIATMAMNRYILQHPMFDQSDFIRKNIQKYAPSDYAECASSQDNEEEVKNMTIFRYFAKLKESQPLENSPFHNAKVDLLYDYDLGTPTHVSDISATMVGGVVTVNATLQGSKESDAEWLTSTIIYNSMGIKANGLSKDDVDNIVPILAHEYEDRHMRIVHRIKPRPMMHVVIENPIGEEAKGGMSILRNATMYDNTVDNESFPLGSDITALGLVCTRKLTGAKLDEDEVYIKLLSVKQREDNSETTLTEEEKTMMIEDVAIKTRQNSLTSLLIHILQEYMATS